MTSPDGVSWAPHAAAQAFTWRSVTYGNGTFVAVSSGLGANVDRVMTSTNGTNWFTANGSTNGSWSDVTFGNGIFVAVASAVGGSRAMWSTNGTNWFSGTGSTLNNAWRSVTYGAGLFVAVASAGTGTGDRVMTSPDGDTWTQQTSVPDNSWFGVSYGAGIFAAVSNAGVGNQVMTSPVVALPLTWLSLNAQLNQVDHPRINWVVEEHNVSAYKVEKSIDGANFRTVGGC